MPPKDPNKPQEEQQDLPLEKSEDAFPDADEEDEDEDEVDTPVSKSGS